MPRNRGARQASGGVRTMNQVIKSFSRSFSTIASKEMEGSSVTYDELDPIVEEFLDLDPGAFLLVHLAVEATIGLWNLTCRCAPDKLPSKAAMLASKALAYIKKLCSMAAKSDDDDSHFYPGEGNEMLVGAIRGMHGVERLADITSLVSPVSGRATPQIVELFDGFVEFLSEECGFEEPWEVCEHTEFWSPMATAAFFNEPALIRYLHGRGADTQELEGDSRGSPVLAAFRRGNKEALAALMELGAKPSSVFVFDPEAPYLDEGEAEESDPDKPETWETVIGNAVCLAGVRNCPEPLRRRRKELLQMMLAAEPECARLRRLQVRQKHTLIGMEEEEPGCKFELLSLLDYAIRADALDVAEMLLEAGTPICWTSTEPHPTEGLVWTMPTVASAFGMMSSGAFEALLDRHGVMREGWQAEGRYGEKALRLLTQYVTRTAVGLVNNGRAYESPRSFLPKVEILLKRGFTRVHVEARIDDPRGGTGKITRRINCLAFLMLDSVSKVGTGPGQIRPDDILKVLKLFHRYGAELHDADSINLFGGAKLIHQCAATGHVPLIDFAMSLPGANVDAVAQCLGNRNWVMNATPLSLAVSCNHLDAAMHLMTRYKADPFVKDLHWREQPVGFLVDTRRTDRDALPVLKQMASMRPDILSPDNYRVSRHDGTRVGLIYSVVAYDKPLCLQYLLTSGLKHVDENVNLMCTFPHPLSLATAAQVAVFREDWENLGLLLKHARPSLTCKFTGTPVPADAVILDSAADLLKTRHCTDRRVKALITEALKREGAGAAGGAAGGAGGSAAPSNAFEDPSTKVLTSKEEKAKAKRRAQKKKARERKRAAAAAAAGGASASAGGIGGDSDSSGDDDDAGLDEDERLFGSAPSFDALKAAREAETAGASEHPAAAKPEPKP